MRKLFIVLVTVVSLIILYFAYSFTNGNPLSKYRFEKSVQEYLKLNYDEKFITKKIGYSFKQSTIKHAYFYAIVKVSDSDLPEFTVYRSKLSKTMDDNVYLQIWGEELTDELSNILKRQYAHEYFMIQNIIPRELPHSKISIYDIPTYKNYSLTAPLNKRTDTTILIQKSYEAVDTEKIYSLFKGIVDSSIYFNHLRISFINKKFEEVSTIVLNWEQARNIDDSLVRSNLKDYSN